jgi:hypothetical protein
MRLVFIISVSLTCLFSQYVDYFSLNSLSRSSSEMSADLPSNSVIDIRYGDENEFYFGTSGGLGYADFTDFNSPHFYTIENDSLPLGGNPAMKTFIIDSERMIVVSGVTTEFADGENRPKGTGVAWSNDNGATWRFMPQSIEPSDSPAYIDLEWGGQTLDQLAVTTEINNVSYDLTVNGNYVYTTSWAGGLRRFDYTSDAPQWGVIPLPMDNQDSLICGEIDTDSYFLNPIDPPTGSHNHKAFSIFSEVDEDIIWVGTADGINRGVVNELGCINWTHFNSNNGLAGDWVVGIEPQYFDDFTRIWAITWTSPGASHSLSYTDDDGQTWHIVSQLEEMDVVTYNLHFGETNIYASTSDGIYFSDIDDGKFWQRMVIPADIEGEVILSNKMYSIVTLETSILVGSPDGLAFTQDNGSTWDIIRFWEHMQNSYVDKERFSVYPNPFYIDDTNILNGDGHVRFIFYSELQQSATIDIFDFAMDRVHSLNNPHFIDNEGEIIWDGRNILGDQVVNGVYFCRLSLGSYKYWTKLLVVNSK